MKRLEAEMRAGKLFRYRAGTGEEVKRVAEEEETGEGGRSSELGSEPGAGLPKEEKREKRGGRTINGGLLGGGGGDEKMMKNSRGYQLVKQAEEKKRKRRKLLLGQPEAQALEMMKTQQLSGF